MFPIPSVYIAGAVAVASLAAGYTIRGWQCDAAYAKALEQAEEQRQEMQSIIDERSRDFEAARNQADALANARGTSIRTIYRDVPAPPPSCAAPDSVVSLLQSGVRDANAAATSEFSKSLQTVGRATSSVDRPRKGNMGESVDSEVHGVQR